ncbi:pyrophosphohydrolase domain-containing protein [Kordiimonas aestuarii]|uniref:nucleotide pyrophosphohydrolase n=1 Tax=Kordiimonas aestuarii TaxID=1005925 RepID=UPI0021D200D3|nr:nucleotide pyrophosphohydrolase [Kordiimonas aestuarii]
MTESQKTITVWAEDTFGPAHDHSVLVRRAMLELEELLEATEAGDRAEIGKETADIAILLYRLMELNGLSLTEEVNKKMAENRARRWMPKGDGTGKHVKA